MADWKCGADRGLSLNSDASWDGAAAKASVFEWAGWPDSPDPAKARRAFLAYDSSAGDLKGSYKLPFAHYEGGKLEAVAAGCRAAASRLPQTDDLPQAVKDEARAVIDHYLKEDGKSENAAHAADYGVFAHSARVQGLANTEELLALAKARALDPAELETATPFFFRAQISNTSVDSYYTKMDPATTLRNFAEDADAGVPFMNSHRTGGWSSQSELPFGQSLTGKYTGPGGNGQARVEADFYTIPDLNLNGVDTSHLIRGIKTGLTRDVSVGFQPGKFICNICGRDMLSDWDCWHIPGFEYSKGDDGDEWDDERKKKPADGPKTLCIASVVDARLIEVSSVYRGATPSAVIIKAQREADAGRLRPEAARLLESRYRISLPNAYHVYQFGRQAGSDPTPCPATAPEGRCLPASERTEPMPEELETQFREALEGSPIAWGGDPVEAIKAAVAEINRTRPLVAQYARAQSALTEAGFDCGEAVKAGTLDSVVKVAVTEAVEGRALAADGRAYRADLVAEALVEGVRALGKDFATETYQAALAALPLDAVKRMRDDWKATGDRLFPGGRKTTDTPSEPPSANGAGDHKLPVAAVKGR